MRKIREVLRLSQELGLSQRQVARSVRLGQSTVWDYLERFRVSGLSWEEVEALDDEGLEQRLFPSERVSTERRQFLPDWSEIHQELKRKGVTRSLLWQEYRDRHPDGYGLSRFCDLYRDWKKRLDVSLRQDYVGGEMLFVDYAGETVDVVDPRTGEVRAAQIFVATLGASSYTYAEATWSQDLRDWMGSHVRAFEAIGGVVELVIPDNLKSGVTKPNWYEPDVNQTYTEMAEHYGVAVLPARVRRPRDKAKVESGVLQVERWILARLRNQTFFSLRELNESIRTLLVQLNDRPLKVLGISRLALFEKVDRPALRPLPKNRYEFGEWKKVRVAPDYHVELEGHYYSVPYQLVREQLDLRFTEKTVEVFRRGKRIAGHRRSRRRGKHTTLREHMPKAHQEYLEWTPTRLVRWAQKTGSATAQLVEQILQTRPHPQQGFRSCLGLLRLGKKYGEERLEAACQRSLRLKSYSYQSVKSILKTGLDRQPMTESDDPGPVIEHANVRGAAYYAGADSEGSSPC
jgi:transposase